MARLTQSEIKAKADEWAGLGTKIEKAENAKGAELEPFLERYNEDTKAVVASHDARIGKLYDKRAAIEAEVLGWLNGVGKPFALSGELATASVEAKVGSRVISVSKFFDAVKDKNAVFWDCVSVAIAKADKLLGKDKVDAISTKDSKLVASLKLK